MNAFSYVFIIIFSTSGREFVRTQTVPSIPIESYLIRKDQTQVSEDVPPPLPPRGKTRKTQIREKGEHHFEMVSQYY